MQATMQSNMQSYVIKVATLARASRAASASAAIARCRFSGTRTSFTWTFGEGGEDEGEDEEDEDEEDEDEDKDKGEGEFWIMSISDDQDLYSFHLDSPGVRCLIKCQLAIKMILMFYILLGCSLNSSIFYVVF